MNRNIIILGWVSFFTDMASAMVTPILPLYVVYVLNNGVDKMGYIVAISTFVSYLLRIFFGVWSDHVGRARPFLLAGYGISAITKPLLAFTGSWAGIAGLRSMERLGKAIRSAPKDALISRYARENEHGKTFGFHKTMDIGGELTGMILVFAVFFWLPDTKEVYQNIFLATLIPGFIGWILVLALLRETKVSAKPSLPSFRSLFVLAKEDRLLLKPILIYAFFTFFLMEESFFILKAKSNGISPVWIPVFLILSRLVQTLFSISTGKLSDKIETSTMFAVSLPFGIVALLFLTSPGAKLLWPAFGFLGLYTVFSLNAMRALISREATQKGSVYGFFYAITAVAAAAGASAQGLIWETYSLEHALFFSIGGASLIWLLSFFFMSRRNQDRV